MEDGKGSLLSKSPLTSWTMPSPRPPPPSLLELRVARLLRSSPTTLLISSAPIPSSSAAPEGRITRESRREGWREGRAEGGVSRASASPSSRRTRPAAPWVSARRWVVRAAPRWAGEVRGLQARPAPRTQPGSS